MEILFTSVFWISMLKIVWVNILLSGDNAVVVALASRSLPEKQQKRAVVWGIIAAIVMRVLLTLFAVELLELPWLKLAGSILLIWIGVQLLYKNNEDEKVDEASSLFNAIKTILIADLVMSVDNVLAVAAAAEASMPEGRVLLIIFGLAMSIPVVIFGSQLILKVMKRFPFIITLGAMLIGWIAGEMAEKESIMIKLIGEHILLQWAFPVCGALLVLAIGSFMKKQANH